MHKEDSLLLSNVEDKLYKCINNYMPSRTNFLDMRQKSLVSGYLGVRNDVNFLFYGGYDDAERTVLLFLPDYASLEIYNPLEILRVNHGGSPKLSHRDYLGAIMGLGIKREMIGDILVREEGADIIILREMSDFLLQNYNKVGNSYLKSEIVPIHDLYLPEQRFVEKRDTVASLRLDSVLATAFSLSRAKAVKAISSGNVFVNGMLCEKSDFKVKEGDKLVIRGKGKAILDTVGNTTRKDRIVIYIKKYI